VADTIDAMISERPYRGTISTEAIIRELDKESGFQFDPEVGQVARKLINQGLLKLGAPTYLQHAPAPDK
jgi:HD-GYP domain-containing protein (c-di-GMP phosphodiesterase class II)